MVDQQTRRALAMQGETFLKGELYAYLKAGIRAKIVNAWIACKGNDETGQRNAKFLQLAADAFDNELAALVSDLAFERAAEKKRKKLPDTPKAP